MRTSFVPGHARWTHRLVTEWGIACVIGVALSAPAPSPAAAQTPSSPTAASQEQRIKQLEDTVNQLKKDTRQVEVNQENQKPLVGWSTDGGFSLSSQDGSYKLRVGGYTQLDGRFFASNKDGLNTSQFLFRRVRPILEGTVAKYFDFRIMPDFAQANTSSNFALYDAYVDVNYFNPYARLRIGKYKTPVGLERLQPATALMLLERGQPTNLVPTRDLGIDLSGEFLAGIIGYRLGIYDGAADLVNQTVGLSSAKDFDGRLFLLPLQPTGNAALAGFGVGLGGTYGYSQGSPSGPDLTGGYRSFGQATIFRYVSNSSPAKANTAIAQGPRTRINPSAYYYWGPFGLLTEYVSSTQGVALNHQQKDITNYAWTVGMSYLLTGENAAYRGVTPAQSFIPWDQKWGAWEVVFRASQLYIDNQAFVQKFANPNTSVRRALEFAFGLNWYLNRNIKYTLDFAKTGFDGGAANGTDRESEYEIGMRLQLLI